MTTSPGLCFKHAKQLNRPAIFSSSWLKCFCCIYIIRKIKELAEAQCLCCGLKGFAGVLRKTSG